MSGKDWQTQINELKASVLALSSAIEQDAKEESEKELTCCKSSQTKDCSAFQKNKFINGRLQGRIYHNCIASNSLLQTDGDITFENCVFIRDELVKEGRLFSEATGKATFVNCLFVGIYSSSQEELMRNGGQDYLQYEIASEDSSFVYYGCKSYNYMIKSPRPGSSISCDWEFAHTKQENRLDISPDALRIKLDPECGSCSESDCENSSDLAHLCDFFRSGYCRA